jgi:hypothetical protein
MSDREAIADDHSYIYLTGHVYLLPNISYHLLSFLIFDFLLLTFYLSLQSQILPGYSLAKGNIQRCGRVDWEYFKTF